MATATLPLKSALGSVPSTFFCTTCLGHCTYNHPAPRPLEETLVFEARLHIAAYKCRHSQIVLDDSILIIEGELRGLIYYEGDLSFLMPKLPVVGEIFASQLNTEIQQDYSTHLSAAWNLKLPEPIFFSKCGRKAVMLPLSAMKERFTITTFHKSTTQTQKAPTAHSLQAVGAFVHNRMIGWVTLEAEEYIEVYEI
jgi:hypothetical protein